MPDKGFFTGSPNNKAVQPLLCYPPKPLQFLGSETPTITQEEIIDGLVATFGADPSLNWQLQSVGMMLYAVDNVLIDCVTEAEGTVAECIVVDYTCNGKAAKLNPGTFLQLGGEAQDTDNDGESNNTIAECACVCVWGCTCCTQARKFAHT